MITKKVTMMEGELRIVGEGGGSEPSQVRRRAQPHADSLIIPITVCEVDKVSSILLSEQSMPQCTTFQNTM